MGKPAQREGEEAAGSDENGPQHLNGWIRHRRRMIIFTGEKVKSLLRLHFRWRVAAANSTNNKNKQVTNQIKTNQIIPSDVYRLLRRGVRSGEGGGVDVNVGSKNLMK